MPASVVLCEPQEGCPGRVSLTLVGPGRCELAFGHEGEGWVRSLPCSISALLDVCLGARTHVASHDGACELLVNQGKVLMFYHPWGGDCHRYAVPLEQFKLATEQVVEQQGVGGAVRVF